jgi:luciferase family oxidoreductase group 1
VLDLAVVAENSSVGTALHNSIDLAVRGERLGYRRYWVAEHHNMPGIASSAPAVLLAHAASATSTIRIGSGGVMLPNHAALVVAEQFGTLEALHPGRIDLGIGRAPGTDQLTMRALRRRFADAVEREDDFPQQLIELMGYFTGVFPDGHPYGSITAVPGRGSAPELWLLGSSTYSAQLAGVLGLPFSFAHHFASENTMAALEAYHHSFRPSEVLDAPHTMLGVSVIVADDDRRAEWLAGPGLLSWVRLRSGRPARMPSPEDAAEYHFTPMEREVARTRRSSQVIGGAESMQQQLLELIARTAVDELAVTTMVHGHSDRVRSYELLADRAALLC